jgi:hypothetical protein
MAVSSCDIRPIVVPTADVLFGPNPTARAVAVKKSVEVGRKGFPRGSENFGPAMVNGLFQLRQHLDFEPQ